MRLNKETFVVGFALFSMFFGAGNLMLPPLLGLKAGDTWFMVLLGFAISAVIIPLLGIFAHARLQGTMLDFASKVSPTFSLVYCILVYIISIVLPSPRTASVTHEIAIDPFFGTSSWLTSSVYFILVLIFVLNRSKIVSLLGKFLTPIIFMVILTIFLVVLFSTHEPAYSLSAFQTPLISGLLEGYQTFDAIGAVVVGGVVIISLKLNGKMNFEENKSTLMSAGFIVGVGLFVIYAGMIYCGAFYGEEFDKSISRTDLLFGISFKTLGKLGSVFLSILVSLACFTTAVGIITGTADFVKGIFNNSKKAYVYTAFIACILGVLVGQFDVHYIITIAIPALMFIYPITIVLILLNVIPDRYTPVIVFRAVVMTTMLFSIPDFIASIGYKSAIIPVLNSIPLGNYSLAWLLPTIVVFFGLNIWVKKAT